MELQANERVLKYNIRNPIRKKLVSGKTVRRRESIVSWKIVVSWKSVTSRHDWINALVECVTLIAFGKLAAKT